MISASNYMVGFTCARHPGLERYRRMEVLTIRDYLPLLGVVIGGVLGIAGSLLSQAWLESYRTRKARDALALAFEGEIGALLRIIETRGYVAALRHAREQTEKIGVVHPYFFRARRGYFKVFEANVGRIGTLKPPLPLLVSRFYTQANAIIEDMEVFEGVDPAGIDPKLAVTAYDQLLVIFESMIATGREIISEISHLYPR
jgi:hypothetical protein